MSVKRTNCVLLLLLRIIFIFKIIVWHIPGIILFSEPPIFVTPQAFIELSKQKQLSEYSSITYDITKEVQAFKTSSALTHRHPSLLWFFFGSSLSQKKSIDNLLFALSMHWCDRLDIQKTSNLLTFQQKLTSGEMPD